jgi:hypothetical protein
VFWVGMRGDLTLDQREALKSAGITQDDLRAIAATYGMPPRWDVRATSMRVVAVDESEARGKVARALGLSSSEVVVSPEETFERWAG